MSDSEVPEQPRESAVRAGQIFEAECGPFTRPDEIEVRRVARDCSWADIRVRQSHGATWTKRMRLPFPRSWERVK
jgi:hypothetical protein